MKELNHHILKEAISLLPTYDPKPLVWDSIDMELTAVEHDANLQISVSQLPSYQPPASIWDNIERVLDQSKEETLPVEKENTGQQSAKITPFFNLRRWAAAAGIFLTFAAGAWLLNDINSDREQVSFAYAEEKAAANFLNVDWDEDEDAFSMVAEFCKTDNPVCRQPDFKIMTNELEELNSARTELKEAMDAFGKAPELIAQLTAIEHERSDLLKAIIKRI